MSKQEEIKEEAAVDKVTASDDDVVNEEINNEPLKWEDLKDARNDTVDTLIKQQMLFTTLCDAKQDVINKDEDIFKLVDGVNKTFNDLGVEINDISLEHATETKNIEELNVDVPVKYKEGVISDDEEIDFIGIASKYIAIDEKILYVASTSYIDIFSKLNISTTELTDVIKEGTEKVNEIKDLKDKLTGE